MSNFHSGKSFRTLTPVYPYGTDPSLNNKALGQPLPKWRTCTSTWIQRDNGSGLVGRMAGAITPATAEITCTFGNLEVGKHLIRIGQYELRPALDFNPGFDDNSLATNLASAISALPGFISAAPPANVVTIETTSGHGNDTRMEVLEWSAASAFTLTPLDKLGYMNRGAPAPAAPLIA